MFTRMDVPMAFTAKENFAALVGFFFKSLKRSYLLELSIKAHYVDYINKNVFVNVKY